MWLYFTETPVQLHPAPAGCLAVWCISGGSQAASITRCPGQGTPYFIFYRVKTLITLHGPGLPPVSRFSISVSGGTSRGVWCTCQDFLRPQDRGVHSSRILFSFLHRHVLWFTDWWGRWCLLTLCQPSCIGALTFFYIFKQWNTTIHLITVGEKIN